MSKASILIGSCRGSGWLATTKRDGHRRLIPHVEFSAVGGVDRPNPQTRYRAVKGKLWRSECAPSERYESTEHGRRKRNAEEFLSRDEANS
jgi:hypothetical protein